MSFLWHKTWQVSLEKELWLSHIGRFHCAHCEQPKPTSVVGFCAESLLSDSDIFMVNFNTFMYCCRLWVHPDCCSSRCVWVWQRSCISTPTSPAASKVFLICNNASMSWGVYPLCWIKCSSHLLTSDGDKQEERMKKVRLEGSSEGPHLVKLTEESIKEL